jgi:hypothetical protein
MTIPQQADPLAQPAPEPPAVQVAAPPESRLEQLQAMYPDLKAKAEAAAKQLKDCTDAIKLELTAAAPGATRVDLAAGRHGPGLQLTYAERWTVDAGRLKREDPTTYVLFAKKSGAWSLRPVKGEQ